MNTVMMIPVRICQNIADLLYSALCAIANGRGNTHDKSQRSADSLE